MPKCCVRVAPTPKLGGTGGTPVVAEEVGAGTGAGVEAKGVGAGAGAGV